MKGMIFCLLAGICLGFDGMILKKLSMMQVPTVYALGIKLIVSATIMCTAMFLSVLLRESAAITEPGRYLRYGISDGLVWCVAIACFFSAFAYLPLYKVSFVMNLTATSTVVVLSYFVMKEPMHAKDVIGIVLGISSIIFLSLKSGR